MTTLELPPTPATPLAPEPEPTAHGPRMLVVSVNLMPEEVLAARRGRATKGYVLLGLGIVFFLLTAGYGFSWWQTSSARGDLSSAQAQAAALVAQQQQFQPLVTAQGQATNIQQSLGRVMAGDLPWSKLLGSIRGEAQHGVTITGVTGTVTVGGTTGPTSVMSSGLGVLNQTGQLQVGTLTITGNAPDKNSVAAFVDRLAKVKGLAAAFPASVTGTRGKLTYSVSVVLTSDALGGRFALPTGTTPGATGGN
jgi:hypothetical protein